MTPQSALFLKKGWSLLSEAEIIHGAGLAEAAGRTAYLAGFHAAQAFIYESTRRIAKTHSGVHSEFARLAKDDSTLDAETRRFLGRGYSVKADADYGTEPYDAIDLAQASALIAQARSFLFWAEHAAARQ